MHGLFRQGTEIGQAENTGAAEAEALGRGGEAGAERHAYFQWQAALAIDALAARARDAGMGVGLYLDLAVGADAAGAEVAAEPGVFAAGASIGAPPDDFSPTGQVWNLPPWRPQALAERGYEPFIETLRAAMAGAGALRIDHVVGLYRTYCRPFDESEPYFAPAEEPDAVEALMQS